MMTKDEKLQETIKAKESELSEAKNNLLSAKDNLKCAYDYETELKSRLENAKKTVDNKQVEFYNAYNAIVKNLQDLKDIMSLYTENYLGHLNLPVKK